MSRCRKVLSDNGSTELITGVTLAELIKRPELSYDVLAPIDKHRQSFQRMLGSR